MSSTANTTVNTTSNTTVNTSKLTSSLSDAARALPKDTILFEILPHFNPMKLSDLREVLSLREVFVDTDDGKRRLITDDDLRECYFQKAWGFRGHEIPLAWVRSIESMRAEVSIALPLLGNNWHIYPPCKVDVYTLETEEDILRAYPELTYVPGVVYRAAAGGAHVLGLVEAGKVGEDPTLVGRYLEWACRAGLDASVIRELAGKSSRFSIEWGRLEAAAGGHIDVVDLLASEFGVPIDEYCLTYAVTAGQDAMIDHLVARYGVDPNMLVSRRWDAIHYAAKFGRTRTVQHLVEKHNADIHAWDDTNNTALDVAEGYNWTDIVSYLREIGATNREPFGTNNRITK